MLQKDKSICRAAKHSAAPLQSMQCFILEAKQPIMIIGHRGNQGWSYNDVLPYFIKAENANRIEHNTYGNPKDLLDERFHGTEGPLEVSDIPERYRALDLLCEAAQNAGYRYNPDFNGAYQDGFGYYQVTQKNGARWSTRKAYLDRAKSRPNLHILTNAFVQKIGFESDDSETAAGKTARYVHIEKGGAQHTLTAGKAIILCAGAIQSPQILELSGIGSYDILQQYGIQTRHHLGGVGENLADHYVTRLAWRINDDLSLNGKSRGVKLLGEIFKYGLTGKGVLALPAGILGGFVPSDDMMELPDIQYHIANASFENPAKRIFDKFGGLTIGTSQLRPHSKGYVHIQSANIKMPHASTQNILKMKQIFRLLWRGCALRKKLCLLPLYLLLFMKK